MTLTTSHTAEIKMEKRRTIMFIKAFATLLILSASLFAAPSILTVNVDTLMLHANTGNVYTGKLTYTVEPDTTDSAFVSVKITSVTDGSTLTLDTSYGDIGIIHILPSTAERAIWFKHTGVVSGQYKATLTVDAVVTANWQKAADMVNGADMASLVAMLSGNGSFFITPGITTTAGTMPEFHKADGPHGVGKNLNAGKTTAFLTDGGMACTWSTDFAYQQAIACAQEFRAKDQNCQLGPAMNIVYHPRLGRAFEYYSEDPYLAGKLAAAAVRGIQSVGVMATPKHFACNNMETNRAALSADIDERSFREIFTPHFRECIVEGGAYALMTAYNMINLVFSTGNKFLVTDLLRNEWGFKGMTMSDYLAFVSDPETEIKYGVDQELPTLTNYSVAGISPYGIQYARMHARNIIYANSKVGMLDPSYTRTAYASLLNSTDHQNLVRTLGTKALILAKNDGNALPIPKTGKKICLTGPEIDVCRLGGGDNNTWESCLIDAYETVSPLAGITAYLAGVGTGATTIVTDQYSADYIVCAIGVHHEGEGKDRTSPNVEDETSVTSALNVAKTTGAKVVVLFTGGSAALPGAWSTAPAILICFGPGQEQGKSIADVLFGDVNPSGKLPVTFANSEDQLPNFTQTGTALPFHLAYPPATQAHGYFKVDYMAAAPLFAFGHGLSYTTFSYSNLNIYPQSIKKGDKVTVTLNVTNSGTVAGDEIVQLYLSLPKTNSLSVPVRVQELKGFSRVSLTAGQTKPVTFELTSKEMQYFKVGAADFDGTGKWDILSGTYGVRVGTSSRITPQPEQPSVSTTFVVQ
jgi:beta-glucosidase